jgi:choline dehydrogenase-like flavoprotein
VLSDSRQDLVEADICVIGAGPAGISFAHECAGGPHRVALLESGWFEPDRRAQLLSRGLTESQYHAANAIACGRLRQFGGTSNLWVYKTEPDDGRRCARALAPEAVDFEDREPRSGAGWPFCLDAMRAFYERA